MSLSWTYLLIIAIYIVLGALYVLNQRVDKEFLNSHPHAKVYKGERKDFFSTIAWSCIIITTIINVMSIFGGNGINVHTISITVLVIGMSCLTKGIKVMLDEHQFNVAGFKFETNNIKKFEQKNKGSKIKNSITFDKSINGYEGIEFFLEANVSKELKELIENKK